MSTNGTPNDGTETPQTGHPPGFFFLFFGEFAERFSFYGMRAILPLYLSDQMGFGQTDGGRYYTFFLAACYLLPLLGGYIADNFFGKYLTIVGFSLPYVLGQFMVGFENKYFLIAALALLAMGTGVIKPNISTLMGLTYDQYRPGQEKLRSNAFQYFYMSINIGAFLAQILVPIVRDETGSYLYAFMLPAVFMVVALAIFAAGKPYYAKEIINRHRPPASPEETATKMRVLGQVSLLFLLVTFFWAVFDQSSYTWVFFAQTYMDRTIFGYELAPDSIQALNPLFIVIFIGGTMVVRTLKADSSEQKPGISATGKMQIGFILTAATMGIMAIAGYLTGDPKPVLKISTKEVEILVPMGNANVPNGTGDFKEETFTAKEGTVTPNEGTSPILKMEDLTVKSGDKITFQSGYLDLGENKKLYFTNGKVDFEKSRGLIKDGKLELPGAISAEFKRGEYALADGKLVIGKKNAAEVKTGEKVEPKESKSKDKPKVSIEPSKYVEPSGRVSMWWMALAFLVITVAEVLISVTGLELAFVVAPQSMKGFITACWLVTVFVANMFINAPIAGLYPAMHPGDYFLFLMGAGAVVALLFIPVSRKFNAALAKSAQGR